MTKTKNLINPDNPDNDRRDFSLSENYSVYVTSRFIVASKDNITIAIVPYNTKHAVT